MISSTTCSHMHIPAFTAVCACTVCTDCPQSAHTLVPLHTLTPHTYLRLRRRAISKFIAEPPPLSINRTFFVGLAYCDRSLKLGTPTRRDSTRLCARVFLHRHTCTVYHSLGSCGDHPGWSRRAQGCATHGHAARGTAPRVRLPQPAGVESKQVVTARSSPPPAARCTLPL